MKRRLVAAVALGIAVSCDALSIVSAQPVAAQADTSSTAARVSTDSIFRRDSFWYQPIPADVPLNPKSEAYVADFLRQKKSFYGTVGIATVEYSSPVYVVDQTTPTVKVAHSCRGYRPKTDPDESLDAQWAAVPIPAYAKPAKGTDSEMTIYQPSTDRIWEFWLTRKDETGWFACWGGMMANASKNQGVWDKHYGTTATSLPFLGGQVTAEELRRGEIRHAIGIALVEPDGWEVVSWPATRSDGWNPNKVPNRIPEGLRFRLDPTVNVDTLQMHPVGKIIAKAAQKYGFVVWDKAGALSIRAQNSMSYTAAGQPDPYAELFKGVPQYAILDGFPWNRLQFLPMNYGKP